MTDKKKNGEGPYRTPGDVEVEPEYRTTSTIAVPCRRNTGGTLTWQLCHSIDPIVPPGLYRWRLVSTAPVVLHPAHDVANTNGIDMTSIVMIIWTWRREKYT